MNDVLSLNSSIFGNLTKEKRVSRKTRKAMVLELYVPEEAIVMSYEDACSVDGGGTYTFEGATAVTQIAGMIFASIVGAGITVLGGYKSIVLGVGMIGTGVGTVFGVLACIAGFIGVSYGLVTGIVGLVNAAQAIYYTNKTGGFKETEYKFLTLKWSAITGL